MNILKMLKFADFFSIMNLLLGVISIFASVKGMFDTAAVFLVIAVVMDLLDGRIARFFRAGNSFGLQVDSLADVVSFGVAVAVFGYCIGLNNLLSIGVLCFFTCCGMLRLARFNISSNESFEGVPITLNGLLFPVLYFVLSWAGIGYNIILVVYFIIGILMVSSVGIRKR